jgi:hypothetical protein
MQVKGSKTMQHSGIARRPAFVAVLVTLAVLLAACQVQMPPTESGRGGSLAPTTVEALNPQPPLLPGPSDYRPLPDVRPFGGAVVPIEIGPLAASTVRVGMSLLVIGATADDPALAAWEALLGQFGIPHEVLVAAEEELTVSRLVVGGDTGRFQGVLLATNNLAYDAGGGSFESAFSDAEWQLLFEYQRAFGVRQVSLYTFPGATPEAFGIELAEPGSGAPEGYFAEMTPAGADVFTDLVAGAQIPIRLAWVYRSRLTPDSTAVPLLIDASGNVLAVSSVASDGRERLALTFDQAAYGGVPLLHTQLLGPGLLRWVTRGLYLGERRLHLAADIDDWFIPTGLWDVDLAGFSDEEFVLSARDAASFAGQQQALRAAFPGIADDFTWTMAYNGEGADLGALENCDPDAPGATLSNMTHCVADDFFWVNHTWSHAYMDRNLPYYDIAYPAIIQEIQDNDVVAVTFGFGDNFAPRSLVTGDISGLGWHAPLGPDTGPKVDFGLEASNPDLLAAAADLGRSYIASNMSTPSHEPDCASCGIVHPLDGRILLVPRWPTNVFAPVSTPEAAVQAYNLIYGPDGTNPFFSEDLTYAEYLDFETDIALSHVLSGSPFPHYFHVANLFEYAPNRSLLTDWADRLLEKYVGYGDLPLLSPLWDGIGDYLADRTSFASAGVSGVWDRALGTLTVTAANGGTAFLTGASFPAGDDVTYGGETISRRTFAPGESVVVGAPIVDPEVPPSTTTLSVTVVGEGSVTGVADDYAFFETATITAVPETGWRFDQWSGDATGSVNPVSIAMTVDRSVIATFVALTAQTIAFDPLPNRLVTDPPFAVDAAASSGLPVSLEATGVCSLSGTTVTLTGEVGTCSIRASQAGNELFLAAPDVVRTFTVAALPFHTLTVDVRGLGLGLVVSSPSGIQCTDLCAADFEQGTTVTLVAVPVYGSEFSGWSGACSGDGGCALVIQGDAGVDATFSLTP